MLSVKSRFNSASNTYENVASVQKECAQILIAKLKQLYPKFTPKTILDLGTGTGFVPEILVESFSEANFTLNDIAPKMLASSQKKFAEKNNFKFILGDMQTLKFHKHDLVVSNLALQWVDDLEKTIDKFNSISKVFAFTYLIDGTFREWEEIVGQVVKIYPNNVSNFRNVEVRDFTLKFPNALAFIRYLKELGASASCSKISYSKLKSIIAKYNQEITVTYKVAFVILRN
jgi:malonyl-CoA O-methyltransferase